MAIISYLDLTKRNNVDVFVTRVNSGGFQIKDDKGPIMPCTGNVEIKLAGNVTKFNANNKLTAAAVRQFLDSKKASDYIKVECGKPAKWYRVPQLFKDKEFGGVAGKSTGAGSERQELGLINAINNTALHNTELKIPQISRSETIRQASKNEGLSEVGQEPYIDVYIRTNRNVYGISCKGTSAPSLAGGGAAGLEVIAPDLLKKLYKTITNYITDDLKLNQGDVVDANSIPDLFVEIPSKYVELILKGNKKMGGPIDFMYVGPMDVTSTSANNQLKLNGNFYSISDYMKKIGKFYFRVRKRDLEFSNNVKIELDKKTKLGHPMVFVSPDRGKNNLRIVITDKVPSTGKVLKLA